MIQSPAPFCLRPMKQADLAAVAVIETAAFPVPTETAVYERELTQNQWARYQVLEWGSAPATLLGYAGYWLLADEAHISTIATHPQWRRRGLGELLLLNLLYLARAETAVLATLEVRRSNETAQKLYQKYQFAVVGERRRYYRNGEDAMLMTAVFDENYGRFLDEQKDVLLARLAPIAGNSLLITEY